MNGGIHGCDVFSTGFPTKAAGFEVRPITQEGRNSYRQTMEGVASPTQHVPYGVPALVWGCLALDEQSAFFELRDCLHRMHEARPAPGFKAELELIRAFIDRYHTRVNQRAITAGVYFAPAFICVNTAQLKWLVGRCKTSINNGFLQLGFLSSKTKVRRLLLSVLPEMAPFPAAARQWTMRYTDTAASTPAAIQPRKALPTPKIHLPSVIVEGPPDLSVGADGPFSRSDERVVLEPFDLALDRRPQFEIPDRWADFPEEKVPERPEEDEWPSFDPTGTQGSVEITWRF